MPLRLVTSVTGHALPAGVRLWAFVEEAGHCPFDEFYFGLTGRDQAAVVARLKIAASGGVEWLYKNSRHVGRGVYELRQPRHLRVFWVRLGLEELVLLGGTSKNVSRAEQTRHIERAQRQALTLRK
jgi:hypothetical protein